MRTEAVAAQGFIGLPGQELIFSSCVKLTQLVVSLGFSQFWIKLVAM
jgi:hypothetical protein